MVTVACESALWAHELDLLQRDLLDRLAEPLEAAGGGRVERLRFNVGSLRTIPEGRTGASHLGTSQAGHRPSFLPICGDFVTLGSRPVRGVAC